MIVGFFDLWRKVLESLGIRSQNTEYKFLSDSLSSSENFRKAKVPEFSSFEQVRVLLFRERYGQERRLLFDSKSIRRKDPSANIEKSEKTAVFNRQMKESSIEKSFKLDNVQGKDFIYEWQRSSPDEQMLREMIFGSVSISYQGPTLKIHTIRSPPQIMISIVFPAPAMAVFRVGEPELDESGNWNSSTTEIAVSKNSEKREMQLAHSVPVNVPSRPSHHEEMHENDLDSLQSPDCYNSLPSCRLSPDNHTLSLPRSGSYNSLQRRLLQNKATSIELGLRKQSDELQTEEFSRGGRQNRIKLGVSVVISLNEKSQDEEKQFQDFLFSHIMLIERHVVHLKDTVIKAYLNRKNFIHMMYEGCVKLQLSIQDLYTAPRLQFPEWLTIISSANHHHLSYVFIQKLSKLLKAYDKKETNFFVSTLLTAVLTHHLAWVPTVIPTDAKGNLNRNSHKHMPLWVDKLAKSRPYNPLWVQLSDLYGAVSSPFKLAKTVVTGHKADIILLFLQVLSYFIRCSDICEKVHEKIEVNDDSNSVVSVDACSDQSTLKSNSECDSFSNTAAAATLDSSSLLNSCNEKNSASCVTLKFDKSDSSDITNITSGVNLDSMIATVINKKNLFNIPNLNDKCDTELLSGKISTFFVADKHKCESAVNVNNTSVYTTCCRSLGYASMEDTSKSTKSLPLCCNIKCDKHINIGFHSETEGEYHSKQPMQNLDIYCKEHSTIDKTHNINSHSKICCESKYERNGLCKMKSYLCHESQNLTVSEYINKPYNQSSVGNTPKSKTEAVEEGYHSMEVHSPERSNLQLIKILPKYDSYTLEGLVELPLPQSQIHIENGCSSIYKSLGWSLMAGVSDHYLTDFCLQGIRGSISEEEIRKDLVLTTQANILGESGAEAVCIVANTDSWTVQLLSSNSSESEKIGCSGIRITMSSLVSNICEALLNVNELELPSESCVIYLEDRLQELYFQSQTLSEYLCNCKSPTTLGKVATALNLDVSDMPLLLSIATTHSPCLTVMS